MSATGESITTSESACIFAAAEFCAKRKRREFGGNYRAKDRWILPANAPSTAASSPVKIFALHDQAVAAAIPAAHDVLSKFRARDVQPASALRRCVLTLRHVNEGGTCLGPDLEAECAGRMRGVCIRRRDFAGGILSSGVRQQRQPQ